MVQVVLDRIRTAGLKLKPDKSHLHQKEVIFFGHVESGEGVLPSPVNTAKIVDLPVPKTARQVKQFVARNGHSESCGQAQLDFVGLTIRARWNSF